MSFVAALTASTLLMIALPVSAQVTEVNVRVDGLSCPFCAFSLEKKLKEITGVQELSINVKLGVATLTPHPGERIDITAIPQAVESAGFTPREIQAQALGSVKTTSEGAALIARDGQVLFALEPNDLLETTDAAEDRQYEVVGTVVLAEDPEQETEHLSLRLVSVTPYTDKAGS